MSDAITEIAVESNQANLERINLALSQGAIARARQLINEDLAAPDIAHLLSSVPPKQRTILWNLVEAEELAADVLAYLGEEERSEIVARLEPEELANLIESFEFDDKVDLLQELPESVIEEVLLSMDSQDRQRVEDVLSYDEDSAGGLMNTDVVTVRPDITVDVVLRYIRRYRELPPMTDNLWVVNRRDEFIGQVPISKILISDPNTTIREIMQTEVEPLIVSTHEDEVAQRFERLDLVSAPVVNESGKLLGRITIDDVVDVIRASADHSLMSQAGLDEDEDIFAPLVRTVKRRSVWLGINLLTAFLASGVIGMFEATLEQVVALAILMPVVASMGGIAGTQALTIVIRGMALGRVGSANIRALVSREVLIGTANGLFWSLVVGFAAFLWFGDFTLGYVIALAIIVNLIVAAVVGTLLPGYLKSLQIDPALAGGVVLTTVTDVVGFFCFLGIATLVYA
ncbi:MAG: magnesium transporter [Litorivicinaceae bacterium]|jgi:magnesium transporter|nr:magnesium transporter [Litorivicinaceae bacterium]MDA0893550.1 magnesium transporter [Pseudomonadota bacterium]MDC1088109.1 magnesium transporter [Litorivicinus sp.]MDB2402732.1 magnesium transporter [Litorivicinaceae bacterium]MDB2425350.1 magnesium transporter [Litorivicinaceae bacterium]